MRAPGDPVLAHPAPPIPPNPAHLEKAAWTHFQKGDHVRALRLVYRAIDLAPEDPGPAFLAAMIYDQGMDRPDLAILEYNRLLSLAPHNPLLQPLRQRIVHLSRLTHHRVAIAALAPDPSAPLADKPLAILPFSTAKPDPSGLSLSLTDLLLHDMEHRMGPNAISPLQIHFLARTFQEAFPDASPPAFARWTGARQTLTGEIIRRDAHRLVIVTNLLDASGALIRHLNPVEGTLGDLPALRRALTDEVSRALGLPPAVAEPPPVTSALALSVYARGLEAYLSGNVATALRLLSDAEKIKPGASLITRWRHRVQQDIQGAQIASELIALYKKRSIYPDPQAAAQRRLMATHGLIAPATGLDGQEPNVPHKPPHTETNP